MEEKGKRVYAGEDGHLRLKEGEYGFDPSVGYWCIRPPGCHAGGVPKHTVTEHEDGTVTMAPSIVLYDADEKGDAVIWHGYLERGNWRRV